MSSYCKWVVCAAAMLAASSCRGTLPVNAALRLMPEDCPTGTCPENPNGRGIYTDTGANYCILDSNQQGFCPEAFVNVSGGVMLEGRTALPPVSVYRVPITATFDSEPVPLVSIASDDTKLVIRYGVLGSARELSALKDLARLTLHSFLPVSKTPFTVRFSEKDLGPNSVHRYVVSYVLEGEEGQQYPCKDQGVSFLPRKRVHGVTAAVTDDANATTMGCESGAIVTCMEWGYKPWQRPVKDPSTTFDVIYRACLQAKRAAYYVSKDDYNSYTRKGTLIKTKDMWADSWESGVELEAYWGPQGATCLGTQRASGVPLPSPSDGLHYLPKCGGTSWNPSADVLLATGKPADKTGP
jgi:hypothetical protein